jgi:D-beta-D-heptose 7-phosphate kinase/D-beta-D-heptose 1-phosphate adenosyltransferase
MLLPPLTRDRAREITSRARGTSVLVIGDAMVDKFIVGRVSRISPEAPVPVVAFDHDLHRMGGAANVASNIVALGGQATIVAVTGRDEAAATLTEACRVKGCVTRQVVRAALTAAASGGVPLLVDPKIPHLAYYAGASVVTPNHHEAEAATGVRVRSEDDARRAARLFRERAGCRDVVMTRGDQGIWLLSDRVEGHLPATSREVADVTGAGDTVVATLALALAAGATLAEAARLANEAAGIVVGKFGPATVSVPELLGVIESSAAV